MGPSFVDLVVLKGTYARPSFTPDLGRDLDGNALTSNGKSTDFSGTLTYNATGLTGGSLKVKTVSIAGILDVTDLTLKYTAPASLMFDPG